MYKAPEQLTCELLTSPQLTEILTASPKLGWSIPLGQMQQAYQVIVSSSSDLLSEDKADLWDTGKVPSSASINIEYQGKPLGANSEYYWRVRFWNADDKLSEWSEAQKFITGEITDSYNTVRYPLEVSEIQPQNTVKKSDTHYFYDFGKDSFGTVSFTASSECDGHIVTVHLGEETSDPATINRTPQGCIRYRKMSVTLKKGTYEYKVAITPDERNTTERRAVKMPDYIGEVMPFRYCELENLPQGAGAPDIKQLAVYYHFDDAASDFKSSNEVLNQVWDLCKYSIKMTTFCGVYVDGDRERIPYEGDAYINQLCHYGVDREYSIARYSQEYLIYNPTWPVEWILSSVMMAWVDYMYTGDPSSLKAHYDDLKQKTLTALAREDGLISTFKESWSREFLDTIYLPHEMDAIRDMVDWPPKGFVSDGGMGEQDCHEMVEMNTVTNAYYYHNMVLMTKIASLLGNKDDEDFFAQKTKQAYDSFNKAFFDEERKIYKDGETSSHASLHSNMFALAFGLVPQEYIPSVAAYAQSRGMACSVYGAQHLLEGLYSAGYDDYALELMASTSDRSWYNMIRIGSTVTLEAWDWKYKNNLDWNHAWGAAPANIIPRFVAGVRPLTPGCGKIIIKPQPGKLEFFTATVPSIRGSVKVDLKLQDGKLDLDLSVPGNTHAQIDLSGIFSELSSLELNGEALACENVFDLTSGTYKIKAKGLQN